MIQIKLKIPTKRNFNLNITCFLPPKISPKFQPFGDPISHFFEFHRESRVAKARYMFIERQVSGADRRAVAMVTIHLFVVKGIICSFFTAGREPLNETSFTVLFKNATLEMWDKFSRM